jgi:ferredoxin
VSTTVHIRLRPMGVDIEAEKGTPLQDLLFSYGVEFPCGGHGKCKGCRVRVLDGSLPLSPAQ